MNYKRLFLQLLVAGLFFVPAGVVAADTGKQTPLSIQEQDSFARGSVPQGQGNPEPVFPPNDAEHRPV